MRVKLGGNDSVDPPFPTQILRMSRASRVTKVSHCCGSPNTPPPSPAHLDYLNSINTINQKTFQSQKYKAIKVLVSKFDKQRQGDTRCISTGQRTCSKSQRVNTGGRTSSVRVNHQEHITESMRTMSHISTLRHSADQS